ncbi:MAG: hypothetical protein KDB50_00865, partial [Mycobacterium sp.]|nr:hypothetical protein [Mycobacterium sp.]
MGGGSILSPGSNGAPGMGGLLGNDGLVALPGAASVISCVENPAQCIASYVEGDISSAFLNWIGPEGAPVAPLIGQYGWAVISALVLTDSPTIAAQQLQGLFNNTTFLQWVENLTATAAVNQGLPVDLAVNLGNAVAYLIQQSIGEPAVFDALTDLFNGLDYLSAAEYAASYVADWGKYGLEYTEYLGELGLWELCPFDCGPEPTPPSEPSWSTADLVEDLTDGLQEQLLTFFSDGGVQTQIATAVASVFTVVVDGVPASQTPSWWVGGGSSTALADYAGHLGAVSLVGEDNPALEDVAAVISAATAPLLDAVSSTLASTITTVYPTFLADTNVETFLSISAYNMLMSALVNDTPDTVPQDVLDALPGLVGGLFSNVVTSLVGDTSPIPGAVGTFIASMVSGLAGIPAVQTLTNQQVATLVAGMLSESFAAPVSAAVGAMVAGLMADSGFVTDLASVVGEVVPDFFGYSGLAAELAAAASQFGSAMWTDIQANQDWTPAFNALISGLLTNSVVDAAVGSTVSTIVEHLLGDAGVWGALQSALGGLVSAVLDDTDVQNAVIAQVAAMVSSALGGGPLGEQVGPQIGAVVVGLLTDPAIGTE